MKKEEVIIKEVKKAASGKINEFYIGIRNGINALIASGKKRTLKVKEDSEYEVESETTIPGKIGYALMKNLSRLKTIHNLYSEIDEEIRDELKKNSPIDEVKYQKDKDYAIKMNVLYKNSILEHEKYKAFMEDEADPVELYTVKITDETLKELDPDGVFDITKIPEDLIDTVFIFD